MTSRKPVRPLEDMPDGEREEWIRKAPVPVRDYIKHLEAELAGQDEELADVQKAEDFGQAIISLWTVTAMRRHKAGDQAGSDRAFRAARLLRVD
jgi:hypothetical protein